jgi:hypothetical protein
MLGFNSCMHGKLVICISARLVQEYLCIHVNNSPFSTFQRCIFPWSTIRTACYSMDRAKCTAPPLFFVLNTVSIKGGPTVPPMASAAV